MRYESAILRGNDKNATAREKHVGSNVAKVATFILNFFCLYNLLIYGWIHCNSGFWFPCYCALCKKIAYTGGEFSQARIWLVFLLTESVGLKQNFIVDFDKVAQLDINKLYCDL
jgi:hypothetical protein